jgi:protein-S-isoprenylcysteine O-methyltransferase Ste14
MSWVPAFDIGVWNAWLFMIIYPLQWLAVIILPDIGRRTSHAPEIITCRKDKVMSWLTQIFWIGASLYSIFLPLRTDTSWMWVGLALFVIGLSILVAASCGVAAAQPDKPFTSGVYRFSRHPMYLSMLIVYLAVSIAALSWLFAAVTLITFFLQDYQAKHEEKLCLGIYGTAYADYMKQTARWLGVPR